jgi:hypothetical protein
MEYLYIFLLRGRLKSQSLTKEVDVLSWCNRSPQDRMEESKKIIGATTRSRFKFIEVAK